MNIIINSSSSTIITLSNVFLSNFLQVKLLFWQVAVKAFKFLFVYDDMIVFL